MHDLVVVLAVLTVALSLAGFGLYVAGSWAAYQRSRLELQRTDER